MRLILMLLLPVYCLCCCGCGRNDGVMPAGGVNTEQVSYEAPSIAPNALATDLGTLDVQSLAELPKSIEFKEPVSAAHPLSFTGLIVPRDSQTSVAFVFIEFSQPYRDQDGSTKRRITQMIHTPVRKEPDGQWKFEVVGKAPVETGAQSVQLTVVEVNAGPDSTPSNTVIARGEVVIK